jgi:hypothetical protein
MWEAAFLYSGWIIFCPDWDILCYSTDHMGNRGIVPRLNHDLPFQNFLNSKTPTILEFCTVYSGTLML